VGDGDEDSDYLRLSELPPVLEDDPVSIALSGPAKTEGDSVNGNDDDKGKALRESQDSGAAKVRCRYPLLSYGCHGAPLSAY
jgi:hypothetical protein